MSKLNGKTEKQIREEYNAIYEASRQQRSNELALQADALRLQLTAIADAKYVAATPADRRQMHIDSGLIPYDAATYTDEAVQDWMRRFTTEDRQRLAAQVEL